MGETQGGAAATAFLLLSEPDVPSEPSVPAPKPQKSHLAWDGERAYETYDDLPSAATPEADLWAAEPTERSGEARSRDERRREERPRDDRPRHSRSRDERSRDERSRDERSRGRDDRHDRGERREARPEKKRPEDMTLEELIALARSQAKTEASEKRRAEVAPKKSDEKLPLRHPDGTGRSVSTLQGLGPTDADTLIAAGLGTIADVLVTSPTSHERYPLVHPGTTAPEGNVTVRGRLRYRCLRISLTGRRWEAVLEGRNASMRCVWATSPPHGFGQWTRGHEIALVGVVEPSEQGPFIYEGEPVGIDGRGSGFIPLYNVPGVDDRVLRRAAAAALLEHADHLVDPLPLEVRETHRLLELGEALRESHFPSNSAGRGRVRLAFDELYLLQLGILWGGKSPRGGRGYQHAVLHRPLGDLQLQHGILLDDGQEVAFHDVRRDLVRQRPMMRLLQGDVGAGKGMVALMAAAIAAENKSQVAMVFPDTATAERRFLFAEQLLRSVGVVPMLVATEPTHAQIDAIRRGEVHVAFGTESLLQDHGWRRLGLVVIEERIGHGSVRPQDLPGKGARADLLVMTQAPIPTTLVFTLYRDFDVTIVPTAHRIRCAARTFDASDRTLAYEVAREQLDEGRQIFVAFPVEDGGGDLLGLDDARRFADALRVDAFPNARIGIFSSAMSRDERLRVYDDFTHRRVDVLVCTCPVEDAPIVPNATVMVVEYADRFDLVRLHRLRGHVGQGIRGGKVIFVQSESPDEEGSRRIDLIMAENDGFRIAELDLQARGIEDLLGERAKEAPQFRYVDPVRDRELLLRTRRDAAETARDRQGNAALVDAVKNRWGDWLTQAGIGAPEPMVEGSDPAGRRKRRRRRR